MRVLLLEGVAGVRVRMAEAEHVGLTLAHQPARDALALGDVGEVGLGRQGVGVAMRVAVVAERVARVDPLRQQRDARGALVRRRRLRACSR